MHTLRYIFFALLMMLGLSSTSQAHWSWHSGWDRPSCGSHDKGSKGSHDKGSKGSHNKGSHDKGSKGSHDKGSHDKGSHDKGSKGSHDKGSHDKGSRCHPHHVGKILGVVFEDTNNNGTFDRSSDKRLQDVIVTITDANGITYQVTTDWKGVFYARGLTTGEATVDINESTLPEGSSIIIGNDPDTINVKSYGRPQWHYYGYGLPAPTGNVFGKVANDMNENGTIDDNETGTSGIKVTLVDANGNTHTIYTDTQGRYSINNIVEGNATVTIDPASLPDNAELTIGENPSEVEVKANEENNAGIDGYIITVATYGTVTGFIFEDRDGNGQFDSQYDLPISGLIVSISTASGEEYNTTTDSTGHYSLSNVPTGDANVSINTGSITSTYPNAVQTNGDNPTPIHIEEGKTTDAGIDSFNFMNGALVSGLLFKDNNGDGVFNEGIDIPMGNIPLSLENVPTSQNDVITTFEAVTGTDDGIWYVYVIYDQDTEVKITANTDEIQNSYGDLLISAGENPSYINLQLGKINTVDPLGYRNSIQW